MVQWQSQRVDRFNNTIYSTNDSTILIDAFYMAFLLIITPERKYSLFHRQSSAQLTPNVSIYREELSEMTFLNGVLQNNTQIRL